MHGFVPCSVIASVSASEPKQSILFFDKNGLLLTANRRSRNDPHGGSALSFRRKPESSEKTCHASIAERNRQGIFRTDI